MIRRTLRAIFRKHFRQIKAVKVLRLMLILTSICRTFLIIQTCAYIGGVTALMRITRSHYLVSTAIYTVHRLNFFKMLNAIR